MKITLYTVNECFFSKQEKDYLTTNNLPFEEKNLEVNREFLTEMLTVSNNFAGTPVTKIEKDDGTIVVLKGFTKEEFDKTLGLTTPVATPTTPAPTTQILDIPPLQTEPTPPLPPIEPVISSPPVTQPINNPTADKLNSIINNLQQKAETSPTPTPAPTTSTT